MSPVLEGEGCLPPPQSPEGREEEGAQSQELWKGMTTVPNPRDEERRGTRPSQELWGHVNSPPSWRGTMGSLTLPPTIGEHDQSPPPFPVMSRKGKCAGLPRGCRWALSPITPPLLGREGDVTRLPRDRAGGSHDQRPPPESPSGLGGGMRSALPADTGEHDGSPTPKGTTLAARPPPGSKGG